MSKERLDQLWRDPGHWVIGLFYHSGEDPRVIVPKRIAWTGYTINFARAWAVPVLAGITILLLVPFLFIFLVEPPLNIWLMLGLFVLLTTVTIALCHWESNRPR